MSDSEKNRNQKQGASTDARNNQDVGQKEVQEAFDRASEQGYFGVTTDPTPDQNYTLQGRARGAVTPETDDDTAAEARKARGQR